MKQSAPILRMSSLLLVALMFGACGQQQNQSDSATAEEEATGPNTLTAAEKEAGWQLLFDGESMEHFRGFRKDEVPAGWKVEDGTITLAEKGAGDIITKEEYSDFEFSIDWKISEGGNSGIFFHVSEDSAYQHTFSSGPEMQILDDERHPDAQQGVDGNRQAGALYDLIPVSTPAVNPAGEWNTARIVVKDNKVEHWLNGKQVVTYEMGTPEWDEMIANSKFSSMPGFGSEDEGHIALQDHGDPVWFRNIKVRPL